MKTKQNENITIIKNKAAYPIRNRLLIITPTLGIVRVEWAAARFGQVIPCNFAAATVHMGINQCYPMGYLVADGQNVGVDELLKGGYEWLLFIEDDVVLPPDAFIRLNEYMNSREYPVVSGLYYLKSTRVEPLVYRGRGNSAYRDFKIGDKIWVDGVPTGILLIHGKVLKLMSDESPEYTTGFGKKVKKVFETPSKSYKDPQTGAYMNECGTSDLYWCDRVMKEKVLQRAGWKKIGEQKYPFLVDTNIKCGHIDLNTGVMYTGC